MSYAQYRALAAQAATDRKAARLAAERAAASEADARAALPFLGDDIFIMIAAVLDVRALGRLTRAAKRFCTEGAAGAQEPARA